MYDNSQNVMEVAGVGSEEHVDDGMEEWTTTLDKVASRQGAGFKVRTQL